jgi:hypothetical protein
MGLSWDLLWQQTESFDAGLAAHMVMIPFPFSGSKDLCLSDYTISVID